MRASRSRAAWRCVPAGCVPLRRRRNERPFGQHLQRRAPACARARNACFTMRSSSEWNVITTSRAPAQQPARRLRQERVELLELAIDPDAQRLERPRRRIDALIAAMRDGAADDGARAVPWLRSASAARRHDRPRDAPREPLLAELENHVGELVFVDVAQQVGGRRPACSIHAHVERLVAAEAEAAPSASNCIDDTPRSASVPATAATPRSSRTRGRSR